MNFVFRSTNGGDDWMRISPDLSHNDPARLGDIQFQTITALAESPIAQGLLYAGTDDGRVHVMRGPMDGWTDISAGLHPDRFTSEIVASAYDEGTVYVTQNGRRNDDFAAYAFRSTDFGRSWRSIAGGIPFGPVNVIREDPKNDNVLYVGTDVGVLVSLDRGGAWHPLAGGLPSTFVHDLVIHPRDDIMVAATHGRGMFAFDVRQIQGLTPTVVAQSAHLFAAEGGRLPAGGRGGFGGAGGRSAYIHYWLGGAADVALEIQDAEGRAVSVPAASGAAGLHMVEWSLERLGGEAGGGRGGFQGRRGLVPSGTYSAVLTVNGSRYVTPVTVEGR
jgi:hypothetical protein